MPCHSIRLFSSAFRKFGPPSCLGAPASSGVSASGTRPSSAPPGAGKCLHAPARAEGIVECDTRWGLRMDLRFGGVTYRRAVLHGNGGPVLRCSRFTGFWERLCEKNERLLVLTVLTPDQHATVVTFPRDVEVLRVHGPAGGGAS